MPFDPSGFREAASESGSSEAPPDALYDAEVVTSKIATRQSDGVQWAVFTWRVLSGPHRDAQWDSMHTLERFKADGERNPGLAFTVQALRAMGVNVDDPSVSASEQALERTLQELEGHGYSVEIKRSGTFVNTYPKERLESYAASLPGSGGDDAPRYGQQRQPANAIMGDDSGGMSAPPQTLAQAGAPIVRDVERTGESDVTTAADVAAFDRSSAPQRGDVDPETGDEIPF